MTVNNLHSTETAMLHMHNDILTALDQNKSVMIICMDLSAAFDKLLNSSNKWSTVIIQNCWM